MAAALSRTKTERFPSTALSVAAARHLTDDLPDECRDAARVVVSELIERGAPCPHHLRGDHAS